MVIRITLYQDQGRDRGCKNRPAPFPGRMSYKATKPGLVCLSYLCMLYYCICEIPQPLFTSETSQVLSNSMEVQFLTKLFSSHPCLPLCVLNMKTTSCVLQQESLYSMVQMLRHYIYIIINKKYKFANVKCSTVSSVSSSVPILPASQCRYLTLDGLKHTN